LENEVIGITRYCNHPKEWLNGEENKRKSIIGGTKDINLDLID